MKELKLVLVVRNWDTSICGAANGYVGVPIFHPAYGLKEDGLFDVHGGTTWMKNYLPQAPLDTHYWWIGFDTGHIGDNPMDHDITYCMNELNRLAKQINAYVK